MIYSTDVNLLRSDVIPNYYTFFDILISAGLNPLLVNTYRDQEQQTVFYLAGTGSQFVSFHGVGLAFDICDKKYGYNNSAFFTAAGLIGQKVGFEWGGGWRKQDVPHFQWSGINHEYTSADIIAGRMPPLMPLYKEVKNMTVEEAKIIVKSKAALSDETIQFLYNYRYGDNLLIKLASAMK